jgi:hypothetical protein
MKHFNFFFVCMIALMGAIVFSDGAYAAEMLGQAKAVGLSEIIGGVATGGVFAMGRVLELPHLDANESIFFQRELEFVKTKSYDKKYAELKARKLIPVSSEAEPWADAIVYQQFDQLGMAQMIVGYSDDLKRADIAGKEFINPVKSLGCSYGYNIVEIRKSQAKGKNLEQRKANAAKRAILQAENKYAFLGDADTGFKGFLKHPNVPTTTLLNDGNSSAVTWFDANGTQTKSSDKILRDLHQIANAPMNNSVGVEQADTLLLPRTTYLKLASTPYDATVSNPDSILSVFLKQSLFVKAVDWVNELETAGAGNTKRVMAYKRDPECVTLEIPQDFEQFDPQPRNLEFVIPCHSRFGGVIFYYPLSACYGDGV